MRIDRDGPRGELHRLTIDSELLGANMFGDPHVRDVHVYTPHGHAGESLPLLVDVVGYTGSGFSHTNWKNFGENVPERLDRLIAAGDMPPVVVAFPDCFTRLGGNQYINSVAMGPWEDYLIDEMLPAVESRFGCGGAGRRGIFGKSSGGYGAIIHAMRRADVWSAAACHSGDMAFELVYQMEFPNLLRALAQHELSIEKWIVDFEAQKKHKLSELMLLMTLAMGATYDPDPDAFCGIRMPIDLETCELIPERWQRWLAWDPVVIVDDYADNLRSLAGLYIDCGDTDQFQLVYGARRLHRSLDRLGVVHEYAEFPDDHTAVDYRMDTSLPFLAKALTR
jgi:S-formylglutathione hydrolase FrmB